MINSSTAIHVAIGQIRGYLYPTAAEKAAAYELLVELSTRVAGVQNTGTDSTVRETLTSIHEMFGLTRGILRTHGVDASKGSGGNISLAVIAVRVLNEVFRPVLSTWHPLLCEHEAQRVATAGDVSSGEWERRWPRATQCRAELAQMRASIHTYIDTLSRIAGAPAVADSVLRIPTSSIFAQVEVPAEVAERVGRATTGRPRDKMVQWLDLVEMWQTFRSGHRAHRALDEAERSAPGDPATPVAEFEARRRQDFWFDYVADMGDGFDGTAPIAWLIGRRSLSIPDDRSGDLPSPPSHMPCGELVVFGGDEVYPFASEQAYEDQTVLPFALGVEHPTGGADATLVAIPGNHDWLGGIEHFERLFTTGKVFAGHWKTVQSELWWHVKLPQGWWLWGIDTGLHNEWPSEQVAYFAAAAKLLQPGDRVVLCTPVPLWQLRQKYPEDYTKLRSRLDPLIVGNGARMPLCLSGDTHVFAHFERLDVEPGEDHITAGGGGAFLQPTHNLPERIPLERGNAEFTMTSRWPLPSDSRALAAGARVLADRKNWLLVAVMGALMAALLGLLSIPALRCCDAPTDRWDETEALRWATGSPWAWLLPALVVFAGVVSVKGNSLEPKLTSGARVYGALIGAATAAAMLAVAALRRYADPTPQWTSQWSWIAFLLAAVIGAIAALAVFVTMTRWANSRIKANDTLAFSPAGSTRFKHFLRCRIDTDGDLTVYVVGVDPVGDGWYQAITEDRVVPPYDPAGIPRLHYVWGKTYRKFVPHPIKLAISISAAQDDDAVPNPQTVFHEAATALIDGGHTVMYGGRPATGYTEQLHRIELRRHADNPNAEHHLINYVADYLWPLFDESQPDGTSGLTLRTIHVAREAASDEIPLEREINDLTAMRERMTRDADARLVIGGDLLPSDPGRRLAPGGIEEAYLALQARQPLIIVGGFGGAAALLADALLDDLDPADLDRMATHFARPPAAPDGRPRAGFAEMIHSFDSLGLLRNGLTDGQNRELLKTSDPRTAVTLIWRAVDRIGAGQIR